MINALTRARTFLCDFEDSNAPTWENNVRASRTCATRHSNHRVHQPEGNATRSPKTRPCSYGPRVALVEKHLVVDGNDVSVAVRFRTHVLPHRRGTGGERLGSIFLSSEARESSRGALERRLPIRAGRVAIPAHDPRDGVDRDDPRSFRDARDPVELRDHSSGLTAALDYIFSYIETAPPPECMLPDRARVTMSAVPARLRGPGGPNLYRRGSTPWAACGADSHQTRRALNAQRSRRSPGQAAGGAPGHDAPGRAPALVAIAAKCSTRTCPAPPDRSQAGGRARHRARSTCDAAGRSPRRPVHESERRAAVPRAWLDGMGCVPINNLMEDARRPNLRAQVWQWLHHDARLQDGRR